MGRFVAAASIMGDGVVVYGDNGSGGGDYVCDLVRRVAGAGAGCVIGRHEANKHARERAEQDRASGNSSEPGYTSRER